ncbi:PPC domain-containing DNA-binding protein [Acidimangrovimonas pyrenivorans]|uniref:PPC domain-containing DNA-binding protein n=1 Tax=Acidimangrovimonas pyrenivorans TaxID=2030798 RepID=A0ABV7AER2_9RHOB
MSDALKAAWPGSATRFLGLRLLPGDDLRRALQAAVAGEPEAAGFVAACVGSLTRAELRMAGQDGATRIDGPLEIVALSGTFSADGPHLHLAVSDATGRMTGGHLLDGCEIRTTAEVILGLVSGLRFRRETDPRSGYAELYFTEH